jgi:hypothetical protein
VALSIIGLLLILQPMFEPDRLIPSDNVTAVDSIIDPLIPSDNVTAVIVATIILFTSALLLCSAWLEVNRVRIPIICKLITELDQQHKWNAKLPSICNKLDQDHGRS